MVSETEAGGHLDRQSLLCIYSRKEGRKGGGGRREGRKGDREEGRKDEGWMTEGREEGWMTEGRKEGRGQSASQGGRRGGTNPTTFSRATNSFTLRAKSSFTSRKPNTYTCHMRILSPLIDTHFDNSALSKCLVA